MWGKNKNLNIFSFNFLLFIFLGDDHMTFVRLWRINESHTLRVREVRQSKSFTFTCSYAINIYKKYI